MRRFKNIISFLSSMRTGLFLLAAIGVTAALGSYFLPSNFYQAIAFRLLIVFLLLNMTICTVKQFLKYRREIEKLKKKEKKYLSSYFLKRSGILLLHAGIVLILIGGIMNLFGGKSETVPIIEGESLNINTVINDVEPFTLQVNEFRIEFNEDGSPSQYISEVSIIEHEKVSGQYSISVNNPLVYEGIKFYQSGFGYLIDLEGKRDNGWEERRLLREGEVLDIEGTDKKVLVYRYIPDFDPDYGMQTKSYRPDNQVIIYSVYENGSLQEVLYSSLGESKEIEKNTYVTFHGVKPYTSLIIKKDPGLSLVAAGGIMLMIGSCLVLIYKPKNFVIDVEEKNKQN